MKSISLTLCMLLISGVPAFAGENPSAKLAMHVVASNQYLDCADLLPAACESINVDISVAEVLAAGGYGFVAFMAYDVVGLTGAEFAVEGWPTGRGAPPLSGPYWCPDGALTMGDHLGSGGIVSFPCAEASATGLVVIGYCSFGPLDEGDLPITLEYAASDFSYPGDPHNYVLDCTVDFEEDSVLAATGCTIGGTHAEEPDCVGELGDGGPEGEGDGLYMEATIDKSYLYIVGNYIPRPYHLVLDGDTIRVNGIPVEPLRYEPGPLQPRPPRSQADLLNQAVAEEGYRLFDRLKAEGVPTEVVRDSVTAFFVRSGRVDSVQVGVASVSPYWREGYCPAHVVFPPVDIPAWFRDPVSRKTRAFERWKRDLETGFVIGVGRGWIVRDGAPAAELHRMIQRYQAGEIAMQELERYVTHPCLLESVEHPIDLAE